MLALSNFPFQRLPHANGFLDVVSSKIPEWVQGSQFPVFTWQQFVDQVRSKVNPLCSEDHLKDLIQELQYIGEVSPFDKMMHIKEFRSA